MAQLKNDTFGLVSKLLERDFVNYKKPYGFTVTNEIFKFPSHFDPFGYVNYYMNSPRATRIIQLKNDTFALVSRLLEDDFVTYRQEAIWITVINKICKF